MVDWITTVHCLVLWPHTNVMKTTSLMMELSQLELVLRAGIGPMKTSCAVSAFRIIVPICHKIDPREREYQFCKPCVV